ARIPRLRDPEPASRRRDRSGPDRHPPHRGRPGRRHQRAARQGRAGDLRPGLRQHRQLLVEDHLHRRRRRHPALPGLPDRPARRAVHLRRGQLPADPRGAADRGPAGGLHREDQPAHAAARGLQELLRRLPAQRAPDAGAVLGGVRAVDVLRGLPRPDRPGAGRAADAATAGQAADDGGVRVQEVGRPAVPLPGQLAGHGGELPPHDLRAAGRAVRGRPGDGPRAGHAVHPARRPRAELLHRHRAAGRLGPGQPVRLRLGRHPRPVRPAARRGEPGGHRDAHPHPGGRRGRQRLRAEGEGQAGRREADGLRAPGLQELRPAGGDREEDRRPDPVRDGQAGRPARHRHRARGRRAERRLLRLPQALPERGLLHGADLPGDGLPGPDVHRAVRDRPAARLDRPVAGDGRRPAEQDRPAAPALHRPGRAGVRPPRRPL
ncbi:MAG: Citrate synthase (si), partial [uncultured Corynebacteriales bacterium]